MSNRRRARESARLVESYAGSYSCPDCNSRTELAELAPGVYSLEVRHDATCPYLAEIERRTP